jgi:shikimate kinase
VLIGMMGAGKSSVGRCLEQRTGRRRFDTDEMATTKLGLSIPEIFSKFGEEKFREIETQMLRELDPAKAMIIVTGGGIVLRNENIALMRQLGTIVLVEADEDTLFERASRKKNRPLLQTEDPRVTFAELLRTRTPLYAKIADIRIDTSSLNQEDVAEMILNKIGNLISTKQ